MGKRLVSDLEAEIYKGSVRHHFMPESKETIEEHRHLVKGHGNQFGEAPTGQLHLATVAMQKTTPNFT